MEDLKQITEKIRIINSGITEELLNLLYEYIITKFDLETFGKK